MKSKLVLDILSFLFVALFIYTGVSKLMEHGNFLIVLTKSPLLRSAAGFISWFIPLVEIIISVTILLPQTQRFGLYSFCILMAAFSVYIWYMMHFSSNLPCSCGGIIKYMSWQQHFYFNSLLTLLAALSIWIHKQIDRIKGKNNNLNYSL